MNTVSIISDDRIREEILNWANPILDTVDQLYFRLANITEEGAYAALEPGYKGDANWSMSYDYMINSTLYCFSTYFAWVRMLELRLSFELFRNSSEKDKFLGGFRNVSRALSTYPVTDYKCSGQDYQVFQMDQRAIGEMVMIEGDRPRCMDYEEFLTRLEGASDRVRFEKRLAPLRHLLTYASPNEDCVWKRLIATKEALRSLRTSARQLLNLE